jgi:predicted RecB family nuclease
MKITPSLLYDYYNCPHKVWRDKYGPKQEEIQEDNPFVKLLWERGVQHEKEIIQNFKYDYLDLSEGSIDDRIEKTTKALREKNRFIYQGIIQTQNLFGIPDLLELEEDGNYVPVDIKSGAGFEDSDESGDEENKQKKHYAIQLCLYIEILETLGISKKRKGFIIDKDGNKVEYNLNSQMGVRIPMSYWGLYDQIKNIVIELVTNQKQNEPAMSSLCKLCPWHNSCRNWCIENDDVTQIFYVGRKVRDTLKRDVGITTISDLIKVNASDLIIQKKKNKEFLKGIGDGTLNSAINRGKILKNNSDPVIYSKIEFPKVSYELFFDIEDDPTQEFVYLHGLYIRNNGKEEYKCFVAKDVSKESEKTSWKYFWEFIKDLPQNNYSVYYFSPHEKSIYKRLQKKYPEIIGKNELNTFFNNPNVIDLYQLVLKNTDWPLSSYSIKSLATYSGFKWRDETPSGALSIQWFNEYLKTSDEIILKRILEYNEDDCKATMVLKDRLTSLLKTIS